MAAENRKIAEDEEKQRRRLYEIEHECSLLQKKAEVETYAKDLEVKYRQEKEEKSSLKEQGSHKNLKCWARTAHKEWNTLYVNQISQT